MCPTRKVPYSDIKAVFMVNKTAHIGCSDSDFRWF